VYYHCGGIGDGDGDDALPHPDESTLADGRTILYRDRNGWCPRCEQAWLALEAKGIEYVTILVDAERRNSDDEDDNGGNGNGGNDSYYDRPGSTLPRVRWPDGTVHVGSDDMLPFLEKCEETMPGCPPGDYFPDVSISVDIVRTSIERRFDGVMPRYTLPSSTAPYVYRADGDARKEGDGDGGDGDGIVQKFKYQVTLEEIEEILEEYDDGPFVAGDTVTAADVFYAPYLERFAALLPVLREGVNPRSAQYGAIRDWYDAMDARLPCYSCRVKGRGETWRNLLRMRHPDLDIAANDENDDDAGMLPPIVDLPERRSFKPRDVWSKYAEGKPYLASTPGAEVASRIVRDRDALIRAASAACSASLSEEDGTADAALRELCAVLAMAADDGGDGDDGIDDDADARMMAAASRLSGDAREVAAFLDGGGFWEVPRDIGLIPARALRAIANAAPKPRIA